MTEAETSGVEKCQKTYLDAVYWISFWVGGAVPIAAISAAAAVMTQSSITDIRILLTIWICVAIISVVSVICATILMLSSRDWSAIGRAAREATAAAAKMAAGAAKVAAGAASGAAAAVGK